MTKIAGSESGSISQRYGSADQDPDPHQNIMDQEHWFAGHPFSMSVLVSPSYPHPFQQLVNVQEINDDVYVFLLSDYPLPESTE
jgi:hypothetical protein